MSFFQIKFEPSVPTASHSYPELRADDLDIPAIMQDIKEEFAVSYHVGGRSFSYRPSSILTAINDVHLELSLLQSRESHNMTLSGYTVLCIEIDGDRARFFEAFGSAVTDRRAYVGPEFCAEKIEQTFRAALDALRNLVDERLR